MIKTMDENTFFYQTKIGKVGIVDNGQSIIEVYYANGLNLSETDIKETLLIKETAKQLKEYLDGQRRAFDLPLEVKGTDFQKRVWKTLESIPYGKTWSYKDVAQAIGSPKAYRAVGLANNKNPISIIIPCHRVIGANGKLVGYGGGLAIKKHLLELENKISQEE